MTREGACEQVVNIIWLKLLLNSILLFVGHSRISIVWRSKLTEMTGLEAAEEEPL